MHWNDVADGSGSAGYMDSDKVLRVLWHDGNQFICNWLNLEQEPEQWLLDPVPDLAAAKAVVESWETEEGWEDDE